MLEQQQGQLVSGLQEMYRRLRNGQRWPGPKLEEANGNPLTHDILAALNLLETKHDGSGEFETFEDDFQTLQSKLIAGGASFTRRRGSLSSDSDHSHQGTSKSTSLSTPATTIPQGFNEHFNFSNASSPLTRSPAPQQRRSYPPTHQSPLHQSSPPSADPQLFQPEWSMPNPQSIMKSNFALQVPQLQQGLENVDAMMDTMQWDDSPISYDLDMSDMASYSQQMQYGVIAGLQDYGFGPEGVDSDFNRFIQVST